MVSEVLSADSPGTSPFGAAAMLTGNTPDVTGPSQVELIFSNDTVVQTAVLAVQWVIV